MQNSRRNKMEYCLFLAYNNSVARIVAACSPCNNMAVLGKQIHNFALALISPLRAYDSCHIRIIYLRYGCHDSLEKISIIYSFGKQRGINEKRKVKLGIVDRKFNMPFRSGKSLNRSLQALYIRSLRQNMRLPCHCTLQ